MTNESGLICHPLQPIWHHQGGPDFLPEQFLRDSRLEPSIIHRGDALPRGDIADESWLEFADVQDGVCLPDEFVSRALSTSPPSSLPRPVDARHLDFEFWIDWAAGYSQQGHEKA